MKNFAIGLVGALLLCLGVLWFLPEPRSVQAETTQAFDVWNTAVTPTADILTTSLSPLTKGRAPATTGAVIYTVTIGIAPTATASIMYLRITDTATSTPVNFALNNGVALTAGNAYSFEWNGSQAFTYNFRPAVVTTLGILSIARKED